MVKNRYLRYFFFWIVLWGAWLLSGSTIIAADGDINWATYASTTKSISANGMGWHYNFNVGAHGYHEITPTYSGGPLLPFDGDESTAYSISETEYCYHSTDVFIDLEFDTYRSINEIAIVVQFVQSRNNATPPIYRSYKLSVYEDNQWITIAEVIAENSQNELPINSKKSIVLKNLNYKQVKKVKLTLNNKAIGYFGPSSIIIYEFSVSGPPIDIGLRAYDGNKIIAVACEPEGILTSPLRIRKGNVTYGIVLVDPVDLNASNIRIVTKSGIKALRKLP